ncbi:hypothetical protein [Pseudotabrizicola sp. 4114]|uniref:hypothetical protein n=1 Tax=Pseudotabrizicola sp. 4114 TaxID=2817731 RepID=UPI0028651936|nr:hypothetical protein [Pseudorhodobacter sp. 4114]
MSDFTLYYWPVPFRGEFVRAILAHANATVDEPGSDAVSEMMQMDPRDQPVPHMAPPMLVENASCLYRMRDKGWCGRHPASLRGRL